MVACQTGHLSALRHGNTAYRHLRGRLRCAVKPFDLTEQANMPYTHLERLSACSVFCSRVYPATDTGFRTKNRPSTGLQPFSD